jgi:hypothetical protein
MYTTKATMTKKSEYQTMSTSDAAPVAVPAKDCEVVKAGDADRVDLLQGGLSPKRGHKFCGGCCDVRRGVIIVNMVVGGLTLCVFIAGFIAIVDFSFGNCLVGHLVGCLHFWYHGSNPVQHLHGWSSSPQILCGHFFGSHHLQHRWFGSFCLFLYPHVIFIKEVREGIMSKENYDNERHSCCCV